MFFQIVPIKFTRPLFIYYFQKNQMELICFDSGSFDTTRNHLWFRTKFPLNIPFLDLLNV